MNIPEPIPIHHVPMWFDVSDCVAHRPPVKLDSMVEIFDHSMWDMYGRQGPYLPAMMIVGHSNMTNGIHLIRIEWIIIIILIALGLCTRM